MGQIRTVLRYTAIGQAVLRRLVAVTQRCMEVDPLPKKAKRADVEEDEEEQTEKRVNLARRAENVQKLFNQGHSFDPHLKQWYCQKCYETCRPEMACRWIRCGRCRGREPLMRRRAGYNRFRPGEMRPHSSHTMVSQGTTHWCEVCGAWSEKKLEKLGAPCERKPMYTGNLDRIARGLHPDSYRGKLEPEERVRHPRGVHMPGVAEQQEEDKERFDERAFDWSKLQKERDEQRELMDRLECPEEIMQEAVVVEDVASKPGPEEGKKVEYVSPLDCSEDEFCQDEEDEEEDLVAEGGSVQPVAPTRVQRYQEQAATEDAFERRRRRLEALDPLVFKTPGVWGKR